MKWFKHDSDASNDAKLKKLRLKYGAQGYGIYWYCLELIARNVERHNLTFELEHDAELIADDFKLSTELTQHIMTFMVELGLFENTNGIISCLKMASRTDEYTQKLIQSVKKYPDNVGILSGQNPEMSVLIEQNRIDEIRLEKKIKPLRANALDEEFEQFWKAYPKKKDKQKAKQAWHKQKPPLDDVLFALSWQRESAEWKKEDGKYIKHPERYLNAGSWQDEPPVVDMNPF